MLGSKEYIIPYRGFLDDRPYSTLNSCVVVVLLYFMYWWDLGYLWETFTSVARVVGFRDWCPGPLDAVAEQVNGMNETEYIVDDGVWVTIGNLVDVGDCWKFS
jgi:hypothetical protein